MCVAQILPNANAIIATGLRYLKTPYKVGSVPFQTKTFDCSSFVQYVFFVNGILLPRYSIQQSRVGITIPFQEMNPGDLVFFTTHARMYRIRKSHVKVLSFRPDNDLVLFVDSILRVIE